MSFRVVLIDDNREERERLARKLRTHGFIVDPTPPPKNLIVDGLVSGDPNVVLVDYQLNEREPGRPTATYRGSALAAAIRDKLENVPILLVTKRSMTARLGPAHDLESAFDDIRYKDDIKPTALRRELKSLSAGFQQLASLKKTWKAVVTAMGAEGDEEDLLRRADPPQALLEDKADKRWRVAELARWLRKTVIQYPGILYSPEHAAALLGITMRGFLRPDVQRFVFSTRYRGPFEPAEGRWWVGRLFTVAWALMKKSRLVDKSIAYFADAWAAAGRESIPMAVCNTSRQKPADAVCYVLHTPVMKTQSYPYLPDSRPACMDVARVSIRALRDTDEYDERLFAPDARPLVEAELQAARK